MHNLTDTITYKHTSHSNIKIGKIWSIGFCILFKFLWIVNIVYFFCEENVMLLSNPKWSNHFFQRTVVFLAVHHLQQVFFNSWIVSPREFNKTNKLILNTKYSPKQIQIGNIHEIKGFFKFWNSILLLQNGFKSCKLVKLVAFLFRKNTKN